jgi:hypothetical protein
MWTKNGTDSVWHEGTHHWNGNWHNDGKQHSWARGHAGPVFGVVISGLIVLGSMGVVLRMLFSVFRRVNVNVDEEDGEIQRDGKGSAKRLRQLLVIALLCSDAAIA